MEPITLPVIIEYSGKVFASNNMYSRGAHGRRFLCPDYAAYKKELRLLSLAASSPQQRDYLFKREIFVNIYAEFKNKRRDIDGMLKPILDAFQGTLYENDCQVVQIFTTKKNAEHDYLSITIAGGKNAKDS